MKKKKMTTSFLIKNRMGVTKLKFEAKPRPRPMVVRKMRCPMCGEYMEFGGGHACSKGPAAQMRIKLPKFLAEPTIKPVPNTKGAYRKRRRVNRKRRTYRRRR